MAHHANTITQLLTAWTPHDMTPYYYIVPPFCDLYVFYLCFDQSWAGSSSSASRVHIRTRARDVNAPLMTTKNNTNYVYRLPTKEGESVYEWTA